MARQPRPRGTRPGLLRFFQRDVDVYGMSAFDRFACWASAKVSRAPFFAFCVLLIVVWLPSYFIMGSLDTWQLVINTITTIVTFLLVALLQNSQQRFENAVNAKLNAIADFLADTAAQDESMSEHVHDLKRAVGIEETVSS